MNPDPLLEQKALVTFPCVTRLGGGGEGWNEIQNLCENMLGRQPAAWSIVSYNLTVPRSSLVSLQYRSIIGSSKASSTILVL
jgi:hypothetical protein